MSVGFYRINKGGLRALYSLLVRLTHNSHPFLFFSLEGRSFLWSFLPSGSHVTSRGISRYTTGNHMINRGISSYSTGNHVTFHGISEIHHWWCLENKATNYGKSHDFLWNNWIFHGKSCDFLWYIWIFHKKSHDSHWAKKIIEMIYLPERKIGRGESCESTSPANYEECASHPYLSFRNLQTSVGLVVGMV